MAKTRKRQQSSRNDRITEMMAEDRRPARARVRTPQRRRTDRTQRVVPPPPARGFKAGLEDNAERDARLLKLSLQRKIKLQRTIKRLARDLNGYEAAARVVVHSTLMDIAERNGFKLVGADSYNVVVNANEELRQRLEGVERNLDAVNHAYEQARGEIADLRGESRAHTAAPAGAGVGQ